MNQYKLSLFSLSLLFYVSNFHSILSKQIFPNSPFLNALMKCLAEDSKSGLTSMPLLAKLLSFSVRPIRCAPASKT